MIEFNVGDLVRATTQEEDGVCGGSYTTYDSFFDLHEDLKIFKEKYIDDEEQGVKSGNIYQIVSIKKHQYFNELIYVLEDIQTNQIYLMNNSDNEMELYTK